MTVQLCPVCAKEMEETDRYCSSCGSELQAAARACAKCHQLNPEEAHFCMACGDDLAAQEIAAAANLQEIHHLANTAVVPLNPIDETYTPKAPPRAQATSKKGAVWLGAVLVILAGLVGGFYYLSYQNTQQFLHSSAELANQITASNQLLIEQLSVPITAQTVTSLQQTLAESAEKITEAASAWAAMTCPNQYQSQHDNLQELVQVQTDILAQVPAILANPLANETDNKVATLRENITRAQDINNKLQLPGVQITGIDQLSEVANQLSAYSVQQRQLYQKKTARLNALNTYFQLMDSVIQKNNDAKTGLGSMLDKIRGGEYAWPDYFKLIDSARATREGLRSQVSKISSPAGTEEFTAELSRLLTLSINYCDIMKAGATLESKASYDAANQKYIEAQTLNDQIQAQYAAFINNYQAGKSTLTKLENL